MERKLRKEKNGQKFLQTYSKFTIVDGKVLQYSLRSNVCWEIRGNHNGNDDANIIHATFMMPINLVVITC